MRIQFSSQQRNEEEKVKNKNQKKKEIFLLPFGNAAASDSFLSILKRVRAIRAYIARRNIDTPRASSLL